MSIRYQELDRRKAESASSYDKRINALDDKLIGYAYFGTNGYDAGTNRYGLYVVWNGEINSKLKNSHPEFGYCVICDLEQARIFCANGQGIGIYGQLYSENFGLSVRDMHINFDNISYKVAYLGMSVSKPDNVCFFEMDDSFDISPVEINGDINTLSEACNNIGSFNVSSFNIGSFNIRSINIGSFNIGSFNIGSFNIGSFNIRSFNTGSFSIGSFNISSFNTGSFNIGSFNIGSFNIGSFNIGSFNFGSLGIGSFSNEGFNAENINLGDIPIITTLSSEEFNLHDFYKDVFGIGYLGYGLNLI